MTDIQNNLIVGMIKDLKKDNKTEHGEIKDRLDKVNGNIFRMKKRQLVLRGVLMGIFGILLIFGFLPERLWMLFKTVF